MHLIYDILGAYLVVLVGAFVCDVLRPVGHFVRTKTLAPYLALLPIWDRGCQIRHAGEILSVPVLMKLHPRHMDEPDLESDIISFCSERCRFDYVKANPEYTEANFFYESISEDGEGEGLVTCAQCGQTKKAPE